MRAAVPPAAFFILWNPAKFDWDQHPRQPLARCLARLARRLPVSFAWSCGRTRTINAGDRLFLLRQGRDQGIIASGWATGVPRDGKPGEPRRMVELKFDVLLPEEQVLPRAELERTLPEIAWRRIYSGGRRLPDALVEILESCWKKHLDRLGVRPVRLAGQQGLACRIYTRPEIALSVKQPYLEAILRGQKQFEYRSRSTRVRGRVYLYASTTPLDFALQSRLCAQWSLSPDDVAQLPRGVVAGSVEIVDCEYSASDGCYRWRLAGPRRLARLLPPTGRPQPVWFRPFASLAVSPEEVR